MMSAMGTEPAIMAARQKPATGATRATPVTRAHSAVAGPPCFMNQQAGGTPTRPLPFLKMMSDMQGRQDQTMDTVVNWMHVQYTSKAACTSRGPWKRPRTNACDTANGGCRTWGTVERNSCAAT
eukprot:9484116-Pyramimonas_sp.AAC.1